MKEMENLKKLLNPKKLKEKSRKIETKTIAWDK